MGLVNFVSKHITNYGANVSILTEVLHSEKTENGFKWGKPQKEAFETLRKAVQSPVVLHNIQYVESDLLVYTDASDRALGVVLFQRFKDGKIHLVDMISKIIHKTKRNVGIHRKEFNSIILAMDCFHDIFCDNIFKKIFFCDSKCLYLLSNNAAKSPKIHRFLCNVKDFYRPVLFKWVTSKMNPSDCLTRLLDTPDAYSKIESDMKPLEIMALREVVEKNPQLLNYPQILPVSVITRSMAKSPEFQDELINDTVSQLQKPSKRYHIKDTQFIPDVVYPIKRSDKETTDHDRDRTFKELLQHMEETPKTPLEKARKAHTIWHLSQKVLVKMFSVTKKEAFNIVNSCSTCRQCPSPNRHAQVPDRVHTCPNGPNVCVSMDIMFLNESNGYNYILVTMDDFSRFCRVAPMKRCTSKSTFDTIYRLFSDVGLPISVKSDCGANFVSGEFKSLLARNNVLLKLISPGRSNGNRCEKTIRSIRSFLDRIESPWHEPETIYKLNLYLNTICNTFKGTSRPLNPYEITYAMEPQISRYLKLQKPDMDFSPTQVDVDYSVISSAKNTLVTEPRKNLGENMKPGDRVYYRKFGRKSAKLCPSTIEYLGTETVTLRNEHDNLVTRNYEDVIR